MTKMSESYYPPPVPAPSNATDPGRLQPSRTPQLGLVCVAVGLGIFLAVIASAVVYVGLGSESTVGWSVLGVAGLGIAAGFGNATFARYSRSTPVQWWQILGAAFGAGLLLNSIHRAAGVGPLSVLVGIVNAVSLILLIVGGIVAVVQAASKPATASPRGSLVAPIVGYTADGQPVYGSSMQAQSTNVFAVLALVFGILGGLLGIVFGHIALSQIRRTGEGGRGIAIAGLVLGYIYLAFWLLMVVGYGLFSLS